MPWNKPYQPPANRRLDRQLYADPNQVAFVTVRAYAGSSPFLQTALSQMAIRSLVDLQQRGSCVIYAYCLMPDHLHVVLSPCPGHSALTLIDRYKGLTTHHSWSLGWRGKLWQPRYYDHLIRREESLVAIIEYVLANPVRKGLVEHPEAWPWSGCPTPVPA